MLAPAKTPLRWCQHYSPSERLRASLLDAWFRADALRERAGKTFIFRHLSKQYHLPTGSTGSFPQQLAPLSHIEL